MFSDYLGAWTFAGSLNPSKGPSEKAPPRFAGCASALKLWAGGVFRA